MWIIFKALYSFIINNDKNKRKGQIEGIFNMCVCEAMALV